MTWQQIKQAVGLVPATVKASEPEQPAAVTFSAPVELVAAEGEGKRPTFKITAYTGVPMNVDAFFYPVVLDLSGVKASRSKVPVLLNHDPSRIVGMGEPTINSRNVRVEGTVTGEGGDAETVVTHAKNGFEWQASVGAKITRREFLEAGKTTLVNGRKVSGPLIIGRESVIGEVSFVAMGADGQTSATVSATQSQGSTDMTFEQWLQAKGFDIEALDDQQKDSLQAMFDAENQPSGGSEKGSGKPVQATGRSEQSTEHGLVITGSAEAEIKAYRESLAAERKRSNAIQRICAKAGHPTIKVDGQDVDLEAHAIESEWSAEQVELHVLRAARPKAPAGHVHGDEEANHQVIEAALMRSVGVSEEFLGEQYDEKVMEAALSKGTRDFTLHTLMGTIIRAAGQHYHGSYKSDDFIRAAYRAEQQIHAAAGGFSTLSLSNILENVANKTGIAIYQAIMVAWPEICRVASMNDFKVHSRYRLDSTGSFKKVGPDGELKHAGLSDAKYTNQLDTYGTMIALTRQMQRNDDLDAFLDIPRLIFRMGAVRLEEAVFVLLLSNPGSFFSAGNGNLRTGATSALSVDALTDAKEDFLNQVDSNGKPILSAPKKLLVGSPLVDTAEVLITERLLIDGTSTDMQPARNPHAGTLDLVKSPYLNNTSITDQDGNAITGQSDTQWYLFADPMVIAALCVGFLNGQRTPIIESGETSFSTLGMQWRGYHDFGVGVEDPVAAHKSAGA